MSETTITNPTWYGEISKMFNQTDIDHMAPQGVQLDNYEYVKSNATNIYGQVASGNMPPGNPWQQSWVQTFLNWIQTGCPKGTIETTESALSGMALRKSAEKVAGRIRKNVVSLSSEELEKLKKAFSAIMSMDHNDPNGYFVVAGWHGLPKSKCMHHIPPYNPWHRAYLLYFENALRNVEGCEDVTLPYWDINTPIPDVLNQAPFDSYTYPVDLNAQYKKGDKTSRYTWSQISSNLAQYEVLEDLSRAMGRTDWEDFHGGRAFDNAPNNTNISGHDGGHVSIGDTMLDQNVASFDPIFWFYHCNLDRLWWTWQKKMNATSLSGLLKTIRSDFSRNYFTNEFLTTLDPFTSMPINRTTVNVIDSLNDLDVDYQETAFEGLALEALSTMKGSSLLSDRFRVKPDRVNIRVKNLDRIKIPGSFKVHLMKNDKILRSRAFFQPNEVEKCENCVQHRAVNFDFELDLEEVAGAKLEILVEPLNKDAHGEKFPAKLMGNPTVNMRLLMTNDVVLPQ